MLPEWLAAIATRVVIAVISVLCFLFGCGQAPRNDRRAPAAQAPEADDSDGLDVLLCPDRSPQTLLLHGAERQWSSTTVARNVDGSAVDDADTLVGTTIDILASTNPERARRYRSAAERQRQSMRYVNSAEQAGPALAPPETAAGCSAERVLSHRPTALAPGSDFVLRIDLFHALDTINRAAVLLFAAVLAEEGEPLASRFIVAFALSEQARQPGRTAGFDRIHRKQLPSCRGRGPALPVADDGTPLYGGDSNLHTDAAGRVARASSCADGKL